MINKLECTCIEAYTTRNMRDPSCCACSCDHNDLVEQLAKAKEDYKTLFSAFESCQDELKESNESVEHLKQCISVYHSGIVDMFPHPSVTDGTFFVPIEKYNSMVIKLAELSIKQEQVLANNHSSCELECGAYGTYCKCQDKQLLKEQENV